MQLKGLAKCLLVRGRALRAWSRLGPVRVVILRYHSVAEAPQAFATTIGVGIVHSAAAFEQQMELVAREYQPVTVEEVDRFLRGEYTLPRRAVAITFDDGFRDNYEIAAPILARFGLRAAFYVTTGSVGARRAPWFCRLRRAFYTSLVTHWNDPASGRCHDLGGQEARRKAFLVACAHCARLVGACQERFVNSLEQELEVGDCAPEDRLIMDWSHIKDLHEQGHIIGSHTVTHPNLAHVTLEEARTELLESKESLAKHLRTPVIHFSYPSPILEPHWTDATLSLAKQVGYRTAVTCDSGPVTRERMPLALPRVSVPSELGEFRWTLEATLAGL